MQLNVPLPNVLHEQDGEIRVNARGQLPTLDVVSVGEPPDLPNRTPDPEILLWAERWGGSF